MKPLSSITKEDAIKILENSYPSLFQSNRHTWKLIDCSDEIGEPSKLLKSRYKVVMFYFFNDSIDVNPVNESEDFKYDHLVSAIPNCYIKAHELKYKTPLLDFLIKNLVDFGTYVLSDARHYLVKSNPNLDDVKNRLQSISHADIENFMRRNESHNVSLINCHLCAFKFVSVYPEDLQNLECPQCKNFIDL